MYVNKLAVTQNSYLTFRFMAMSRIEQRNVGYVDMSHIYVQNFVWNIFCVFTATKIKVLV